MRVPAAPNTPATITIAATAGSPRYLFAASTQNGLGKFQVVEEAGRELPVHHFRNRSALGRAAMVMAIAPMAPISMMAAARIMTVAPRRGSRNDLRPTSENCGACRAADWPSPDNHLSP